MPHTVLIVDDEEDFRGELRDLLETEYDVQEASRGEEALELIRSPNVIDIVLLDILMPGEKGTEILKEIKRINPDLFVVMLTGYSPKGAIIESLRGHADDFLVKPVDIGKLLETIKNFLSRKQNEAEGVIGKIRYFIEKNYHKNISLNEASDIVCLSPKYISRLFKEKTGTGFNEFKLHLKMSRARELLERSDLNINEIADHIGYQSAESFIRIFKKTEGCTPTAYRDRSRRI